jgi:Flp pilus assembly protein CpaB
MEFAQRLLGTRRGSTILGIAAAVVAGLLLLVYLSQYRSSVNSGAEPIKVLVAKSLIPKGTSGDVVSSQGLYELADIRKDQTRNGAYTDVSSLEGRVAQEDVFPGQQLTSGEFGSASSSTVSTKLTGALRGISLPVDTSHGMVGQIRTGDHVDVYAGFNVDTTTGTQTVVRTMMQNALVLNAPTSAKKGGVGGSDTSVTIRTNSNQAAALAWAADNGKVWLVLRPSVNATPAKPTLVTAQSLLIGVRPLSGLEAGVGR